MKFYVYIIGTTNPKPRTYVGWSNNIDKRIRAHNASKGAKYTRGSKWKLLYKEIFKSCLLYTSPSPRDYAASRMPSSA